MSESRGGARTRRAGRRPTLSDVAEVAGVELSTVSRLLRNTGGNYRPETRARVVEAARELGYRTNPQARALRMGRQDAIAMLVPDLDNFGFTQVLRGAQEVCDEQGFVLLISEVGPAAAHDLDRLRSLQSRVDGMLVAHAPANDPETTEWLSGLEVPAVLVQRGAAGHAPSVLFDEESNAAAMVDFLVDLGHRRIGHISGSLGTDTGLRRQAGFGAAVTRHGLDVPEHWCADGAWSPDGGREAALRVVAGADRPTALAVDSLVQAFGVLSAVRDSGLSVPGDVSVIAIDEHVVAGHTSPALTTVRLDQRELGRRAAMMLLGIVDGEDGGQQVVASPAEVVVRASTAAPHTD